MAKNIDQNHDQRSVRDRRHASEPVRLPLILKPVPLRLRHIEQRLHGDPAYAKALKAGRGGAVHTGRGDACDVLARALLVRDPEARLRFADAAALAAHLRSLGAA